MDSTSQLPPGEPTLTQTKTKTRTRVAVATAVAVVGLGLFVAAGVARRPTGTCDRGSRRGNPCANNQYCNQDCRTAPGDCEARCVRAPRRLRTAPRTSPGLPDLHVFPVTREPENPTAGAPFTLRAGVQNLGSGVARASVLRVQVDLGNDGQDPTGTTYGTFDETLPDRSIDSIAPGLSSRPVSWEWSAWYAGGPHRLKICADAAGAVAESDEGNNCGITVFLPSVIPTSVGLPQFTLSAASPSELSALGFNDVLRFNITAPTGSDISIARLTFQLDATCNASISGSTGCWYEFGRSRMLENHWGLYDVANNPAIPVGLPINITLFNRDKVAVNISGYDTGQLVKFARFDFMEPVVIIGGTTRTFKLRMNSIGASAGDMAQVTIPRDEGISIDSDGTLPASSQFDNTPANDEPLGAYTVFGQTGLPIPLGRNSSAEASTGIPGTSSYVDGLPVVGGVILY